MIYAITFSDDNYKRSAVFNCLTARVLGHANKTRIFSPQDFDEEYKNRYKDVLSSKRGAGYWMWKPYIIKKALEEINDGDYVMYMDAGAYYTRSIKNLVRNAEKLNKPVFLSSMLLPNIHWCKRDALIITDSDNSDFLFRHQIEATYVLVKKCEESYSFINLWHEYASNPQINTDRPNELGIENHPGFRENRHDQTALNLAAYKLNIKAHRGFSDCSEYRTFYLRYKAFGCWGYSLDELKNLAYEEYTSEGFKNSDYKRIVVNFRARDQRIPAMIKEFVLDTLSAIKVDLKRKNDIKEIIAYFENGESKE